MTTQPTLLPPRLPWERLAHIQHLVWGRPEIAYAARRLTLLDQLELTVELLSDVSKAEAELPRMSFRFARVALAEIRRCLPAI
jgi:hypothetical protein